MSRKLTELKGLSEFMEKLEDRERSALEKIAKPLNEIVVEEKFKVTAVFSQNYSTSFTPSSEMIIGQSSPIYSGGYTTQTVLEVSSNNPHVSVKKLMFEGTTPVRKGDNVIVKIVPYVKELD